MITLVLHAHQPALGMGAGGPLLHQHTPRRSLTPAGQRVSVFLTAVLISSLRRPPRTRLYRQTALPYMHCEDAQTSFSVNNPHGGTVLRLPVMMDAIS